MPVLDLRAFIEVAGYLGIVLIVFADTGLLVGVFLPGDSLLFTAGLLASLQTPVLNIWLLCVFASAAAIIGDSTGYAIGRGTGTRLFNREDSRWFHPRQLEQASAFFARHGGKTVLLARFIPYLRTFAPLLAGMGAMDYRRFVTYNVLGGLLWSWMLPWGGYFLGRAVPNADDYLLLIILAIILVSGAPTFLAMLRSNQQQLRDRLSRR